MIVKRVAERSKLNCGQCITKHGNKCSDGPHCRHFYLHKFRHTFATEHLRHGVDIRILQIWMGYRDIKSTMVYLKGVQSNYMDKTDLVSVFKALAVSGRGPDPSYRCLTGPDEERDRMIFWLYFRQGMSTKEIASLPTIRLGTKGVGSVIERLKHGIREQILGSRSDSDDGQELESKANSLANSY